METTGIWQNCPRCNGTGNDPQALHGTTVFPKCLVCNGQKIISQITGKSPQPEPVVSEKAEVTDERDIIPFVSINGIRYRPEVENRIIGNQDCEPGRDTDYPEIIAFLMGIGEIDGYSFGDTPKDKRGKFWWRTRLYKWYNEFAHQERLQSRQEAIQECQNLVNDHLGSENLTARIIVGQLEELKKKAP